MSPLAGELEAARRLLDLPGARVILFITDEPESIPVVRPLALHGAHPSPVSRSELAILAKGFRPFFLLAAGYAIGVIPIWLAVVRGVINPDAYLDPVTWHAHEMVFGFTVAVIAGFLLTAVGNWTGRETAVGAPLLALAGLWLLGRIAMIVATRLPRGAPAILDLAFLPSLIVTLARPLVAAGNRRNFVMLAILTALFAANVVAHLEALGAVHAGSARRACLVAVDLVALVISVIAGRVIPMFTRNATRASTIRSFPTLDLLAAVALVALALADGFVAEPVVGAGVAGAAGLFTIARALHWGTRHSFRQPLLWVLHLGYGWLAIGLILRAVAGFGSVSSSLATHALTVGAIGSLTIGMMTRVALGHTGRHLAAPRSMPWAFGAISAAAFVRVVIPFAAPGWYFPALFVAGSLWVIAFLTFLVVFAPILISPRLEGKPG